MRADGLCNVVEVDGVEMLLIEGSFNKHLTVHIVVVSPDEDVDVAHDLQDILRQAYVKG